MLPIKGECYVTQVYGLTEFAKSPTGRAAYKNFPGGIHPGVDFGTKGKNLPAISTIDGKVVKATYDGGWGNHVEIEGADGWRRQYAHLDKIYVSVGDTVKPGHTIGTVGTTGTSTGVHLHYGKRRWNLVKWEYREPSGDFLEEPKKPKPIERGELVKGQGLPEIYVWNGEQLFHIPDMQTLTFFFGEKKWREIDAAIITKLPKGEKLPSMALKFP